MHTLGIYTAPAYRLPPLGGFFLCHSLLIFCNFDLFFSHFPLDGIILTSAEAGIGKMNQETSGEL
jgi:hypothetical protein